MVQVKDLTELTVEDRWSQVKDGDAWWGEIKEMSMRGVKRLLQSAMEDPAEPLLPGFRGHGD